MKKLIVALLLTAMVSTIVFLTLPLSPNTHTTLVQAASAEPEWPWEAPDTSTLSHTATDDLIRYGRELISHTAKYLGPKGSVAQISNGMNCQNCHLEAGTKPWGNNYGAVSSTYPKYRDRSGMVESIEKKINDCLERSLNGAPLDSVSREMRAMVAYLHWLGSKVAKGKKPGGVGIEPLPYLDRPADPVRGKQVFIELCQRCHGNNGQGQKDTITGTEYMYPPLWGPNSFNIGAGIYRLSKMAGYVKDNMPFGVSRGNTLLSDEQAWDVAAYINAQPRPFKQLSADWPDKKTKPVDHPFGPYTDTFPAHQHKFGPFAAIEEFRKNRK